MKAWICLFLLFLSVGCQFNPPQKPSVLVVAVEGLDFESVPCLPEDSQGSAFASLCSESVRFTHAYTPSVLSQSALSSIMSARYPHEHGVRNNGSNYLSESFLTLPEVAVSSGYRTSFISGGPPIWRKSGLAQGFEVFEDNLGLKMNRYYRPAEENFKLLRGWLSKLDPKTPFFSMVFLADLQFPFAITRSNAGNERSLTRASQLEEIEESLGEFIKQLKADKRWDNTYFVLVGLNGASRNRTGSTVNALNLYSENSHISLLVKPARAQRDAGIEWSVDVNVSLVDLGATLFNILGSRDITYFDRSPKVVSFYSSLERPSISWHRERLILTESDWANWRGIGTTRISLRKKHWFMINDLEPKLYNTLLDRYEVNPVEPQALGAIEAYTSFQEFLTKQGASAWITPSEEIIQKLDIAKSWYENKKLTKQDLQSLNHLLQTRPWDQQIVGWMARHYIQAKDWDALENLGTRHNKDVWVFVAQKKQGKTASFPMNACLSLLSSSQQSLSDNDCNDLVFLHYVKWSKAQNDEEKLYHAKRFLSANYFRKIEKDVSWLNYYNGLAWDSLLTQPGEPDLVELLFLLPEYPRPK